MKKFIISSEALHEFLSRHKERLEMKHDPDNDYVIEAVVHNKQIRFGGVMEIISVEAHEEFGFEISQSGIKRLRNMLRYVQHQPITIGVNQRGSLNIQYIEL